MASLNQTLFLIKWPPIDQMFKLNKLGLSKKVIDGRAP